MSMAAGDRDSVPSELKTQLKRLNLLHRITRAVAAQHDMQTIFQVVVRSLEVELPADFVCICLHDPVERMLKAAHVGIRSGALARELAMPETGHIAIGENGFSRCVDGDLIYEPDIGAFEYPFPRRLAREGLRTLAAVPLIAEKEMLGVMMVSRLQAGAFSNTDCDFLSQLCAHVALAARQAQLYGNLQKAYDDLRMTRQATMQQERLRALGQMAAGIAHDINNAISPLALDTEALLEQERDLPQSVRAYVETVKRVTGDVAGTVGRLQEFHDEREQHSALAPVDLNALVPLVAEMTKPRWNDMPQRNGVVVSLQCGLAPSLPPVMGADHEIREALTNLIFNAVDALPHGGMINIRTRAEPDGRVVLEVQDDGVGMDEVTRQRCLEPFFTTKGERGTGMGLAAVFGVANRHKATLDIESAPGSGTTFRMRFPPVGMARAEPAPASDVISSMRLLVVDDDPFVLESLRRALEYQGHTVVEATGGREGVDAFGAAFAKGEAFSAVITDLGMPYVDGIQVARAVKMQSPTTPVILLTGWGKHMQAEPEAMANVDFFIGKPPKLKELRQVLAQLPRIN